MVDAGTRTLIKMMLNQEHRPIKRHMLGPPEVYAQSADQKEVC